MSRFMIPAFGSLIELLLRPQPADHLPVLCSAIASHPIAIGFTKTLREAKWKGRTLVLSVRYSAIPQQFSKSVSLSGREGTLHCLVRYSPFTIHHSHL